jgi:hypothetical protein
VRVIPEAVKDIAESIDSSTINKAISRSGYPLKFTSMEQEISFLALMRLLDFGSGYDTLLPDKQKSAKDVVQV